MPRKQEQPTVSLDDALADFTSSLAPEEPWKRECRASLARYVDHVFLEPRGYRQAAFQIQLADELAKWDRFPMGDPRRKTHEVLVLWPRNFGKSTYVAGYYPSWRIGKDRNVRVIITSNTEAQGKLFLRQLESIFLNEPRFIELFGMLVPDARTLTWTDTEKIVLGRTDPMLKDATLYTVGVGGAVINRRADIIVADDIVDQENSMTKLQREKVKAWFWTSVRPVLEPGGQLIVSGTRWHSDDHYNDLTRLWATEYTNRADSVIDMREFERRPCKDPTVHFPWGDPRIVPTAVPTAGG